MKNLFVPLLFCLALLLPPPLVLAQNHELTLEQEAAVEWVLDNSSNSITLTEGQAAGYVLTAWHFAQMRDLDPHHVLAMIRVESRFDRRATSSEGAKGLMQVIPRWHRDKLAGRSPLDPAVSIEVGTSIYQVCLQRHKGSALKAANCYSGGGGAKYLQLVEAAKKKLMRHVIARLFTPDREMLAQAL